VAERLAFGPDPGRRRLKGWWRWVFLAAIAGLAVARWFFVELVVVRGNTMAPTVLEGDVLLVNRRAEPAVGDVVLLELDERVVLRRVVALGGERVSSDEGLLALAGRTLPTRVVGTFAYREAADGGRPRRQQHFIEVLPDGRRHEILGDHAGSARPWLFEVLPVEVPPDHLFVVCDNRRTCPPDELMGLVPRQYARGVASRLLLYGEARERTPEGVPIYGAWEWISSRSESSGRK
jgi:signal peptidase I